MNKLTLKQTSTQRLSPQQLQLVRLLQIPEDNMPERIEQELETNPALEKEDSAEDSNSEYGREDGDSAHGSFYKKNLAEEQELYRSIQETRPMDRSLYDQLMEQLDFLGLGEKQYEIAKYIISILGDDGYLHSDTKLLVNDLAFIKYIRCTEEEVEDALSIVQTFDPPGVGARNLQECLFIQLKKNQGINAEVKALAISMVEHHFDLLMKNKISKISDELGLGKNDQMILDQAIELIGTLTTRPCSNLPSADETKILYPDFIVELSEENELVVSLAKTRTPPLRISKYYKSILDGYKKDRNANLKEAVDFAKQNVERAHWFLNAIEQRRATLIAIMTSIVAAQRDFFINGNTSSLRPMTMKFIAAQISMDTSTVSRVVSNKFVKTTHGTFPLKYFFSSAISTSEGDQVSNKEVQLIIKEIIASEDKTEPYSDDEICKILQSRGYTIARRTVAKYREFMSIPTSRVRG